MMRKGHFDSMDDSGNSPYYWSDEFRQAHFESKLEQYNVGTEVEKECVRAVCVYEEGKSFLDGRRVSANRTWPMLKEHGVIDAVSRVVRNRDETTGYETLVKLGLQHDSFEAVISRYPDAFDDDVVDIANDRLRKWKAKFPTLPLDVLFSEKLRWAMNESIHIGYNPHRILQMIADQGAVPSAKKLVTSGTLQSGLKAIVKLGRKDLCVESIVLEEKFQPLFTADELKAAEWHLTQASKKTK
jgi:hypothetical protein